ncbi:hypothetical protein B0T26DRAFT_678903 [Lasiosphaeria miniovina]|uniref:Aminoglycoside phosphotransferase domain-containing protein n=1 Tax=Lasiosphaeria miniovina TaxID=1954250 RepID=A0AA40A550_9PEZI|nr:uncharacterized protein B0T26DRAFT_678903 [Lasiosphaeria miniovina]KAK0709494.1 hypothetical protein B0T26DRAFT_678903 [Lasiosphaeria miniovina]
MSSDREKKGLDFIVGLLRRDWSRELRKYCPVTAIHSLGRNTINWVYRADLALSPQSQGQASNAGPRRHGTEALPADQAAVVVRISDPQALVNEAVRVENEVAAMMLMRNTLDDYPSKSSDESMVPRVYGWSPSLAAGRSWIVQEFKRGAQLDSVFDGLDADAQQDEEGGIAQKVRDNSVPRQTLVYGDSDMFNMLHDAAANRTTALLDYDFAHVATPADEYFYSLGFGFLVIGPLEDDADENQLRKCLLEGFKGNAPPSVHDGENPKTGGGFSWAVAKAMDEALAGTGVLRPADIAGCGELAALK